MAALRDSTDTAAIEERDDTIASLPRSGGGSGGGGGIGFGSGSGSERSARGSTLSGGSSRGSGLRKETSNASFLHSVNVENML